MLNSDSISCTNTLVDRIRHDDSTRQLIMSRTRSIAAVASLRLAYYELVNSPAPLRQST